MKRSFQKNQKYFLFVVVIFCFITSKAFSQEERRWQMDQDGSISWQINNNIPHDDHIEMSGKKISCVLRYGVSADGSFHATRSLVWPMLRTIPNNTHASLTRQFAQDAFDLVTVNYKPITPEKVVSITLNGTLLVKSKTNTLELTRQFFPSTTLAGYCEIYTLKNISEKNCVIEIPKSNAVYTSDPAKGTEGSYDLHVDLFNSGSFNLKTNETISFSVFYSGVKANEQVPAVNVNDEKNNRIKLIKKIWDKNIL
jgi:hypothetical protein